MRWAMREVIAAGCVITLDWLAEVEAAGVSDDGLNDCDRRRYARADLDAIDRADVVWLLAAPYGRGSWVELGYALSRQKRVIVSGPEARRSIFCALAIERATDNLGLECLRELAAALRSRELMAEVGR